MTAGYDDMDDDMDELVFEPPPSQNRGFSSAADDTDELVFEPPPNFKASSAAPIEKNNAHKYDYDGDIIMEDLESPEDIQTVNDDVTLARIKARRQGKKETNEVRSAGERIPNPSCVFVLDTSFILSHQKLVSSIVDLHSTYKAVVAFPWTTILELDGISKGSDPAPTTKVSQATGLSASKHDPSNRKVYLPSLARQAIAWMHKMFQAKNPGVWGQKMDEKVDDFAGIGDDSILDCARYFSEIGKFKVVMLSNDRNLCLKSNVYELEAISYSAGLTGEKILHSLGFEPVPPSPGSPLQPTAPAFVPAPISKPAQRIENEPPRPKAPASTTSTGASTPKIMDDIAKSINQVKGLSSSKWSSQGLSLNTAFKAARSPSLAGPGGYGPKGPGHKRDLPPVDPTFWDVDEPKAPSAPVSPAGADRKLRAALLPVLESMAQKFYTDISRVAKLYLSALDKSQVPINNLKDVQLALATYIPEPDLHRAYRQRLKDTFYTERMETYLRWCRGAEDVQAPSEWDVREWVEDMAKLWKIAFGPALTDAAKGAINKATLENIKQLTRIFEGK